MSLFGGRRKEDEGSESGGAGSAEEALASLQRDPVRSRAGGSIFAGEGMANIGKSISIKGDLSGNEDLVIDGRVEGKIELPSNQLTVGADGKVSAEVHAKSVVIVGSLTGNVSATERVEIQASGAVDGDVRAPRLVVEEGAVLNGRVETGSGKAPATLPLSAAAEKRSVSGS